MGRPEAARQAFVVPLILFVLAASLGGLLLVAALVVWLAAATGSLVGAMFLAGILCITATMLLYLLVLRTPFALLRDRLDTVYETARSLRAGYDSLLRKWRLVAALLEWPADGRK